MAKMPGFFVAPVEPYFLVPSWINPYLAVGGEGQRTRRYLAIDPNDTGSTWVVYDYRPYLENEWDINLTEEMSRR